MNKQELRKQYLEQRLELSKEQCTQRSESIAHQLFRTVDFTKVSFLHIFLPIAKFNEVDTWLIIEKLRSEYQKVKIVIPKVVGDNLEHYLYEDKSQLAESKWGVPEPKYGERVDVSCIDVVLVPLVVADIAANRIGYGKGYYDRFLRHCSTNTQKIGLSLLPLYDGMIDVEETDVKLDEVLTYE